MKVVNASIILFYKVHFVSIFSQNKYQKPRLYRTIDSWVLILSRYQIEAGNRQIIKKTYIINTKWGDKHLSSYLIYLIKNNHILLKQNF